jgi:dipeptidyl aminopeptidase/acylaminoacyl peptidase
MRIDDLARTATASLLASTTPDTGARLAELKRTRRQRSITRTLAAGAVVAAAVGGLTVLGGDDRKPEPAAPTFGNGVLVVASGDIHVVDPTDSGLMLPEGYIGDGQIAFTADGSELVYNNRSQRIEAIDVETGEVRVVGPCSSDASCPTALSPDGRWVAQPEPDEDGISLREVGGEGEELLATPGLDVYQLDWSPDGETLVFSDLTGIFTMSVTGSALRRVVEFEDARPVSPQWSPDGRSIAFMEMRSVDFEQVGMRPERIVLSLVERDGSGRRDLADLGTCICVRGPSPSFAWAPDGTAIAATRITARSDYQADVRSAGLHLIALDGTSTQLSSRAAGAPAWQPVPVDD